ncbi:TPA: ABC transporter permease subunit, partial [Pasteurella multocida]
MFFDYLSLMYTATLMTLGLAVCSLIVGLILSIVFVVLETSKWQWIRKPTSVFVTLLRGLPEILVVLLIYFGSTEVVEMLTGEFIQFSAFSCGV